MEMLFHQLGPEQPRGALLGDLHEGVHAGVPEEGNARRERVHVEAGGDAGAHVLDPVGQGIAQLQVQRGAGLLHVVAGDADPVETRHLLGRIGVDVGDDAQGWRGRIDVGVPHHEFFEHVVLDRAGELGRRDALFLRRDDVEGQDRQHRAVHGHRHAHLAERDARKTVYACRGWNRSPLRPCRRRRPRADGPNRSLGGSRDRRPPTTGPLARRRGCVDKKRWTFGGGKTPHTDEWSKDWSCTWSGMARARMARGRDRTEGSSGRRCRLRRSLV